MTNKILLAKNVSRGNLISPNYEQSYYVYFLPKVIEDGKVVLCEKTRLELVAPSSNGESVVKSYQMIDASQIRILILDLIKGYFYHRRSRDELNDVTKASFINGLIRECEKEYKNVMTGLYDGGLK